MVLTSRSALNGLLNASIEAVAILALAFLVLRARPQKYAKLVGSLLLVAGGALTIAFSLVYQPFARGLLLVLQQGCAGGALACWALRVLSGCGVRQKLTACGSGCAGVGLFGIALYGIASGLGLVGNVTSYTTIAIFAYGFVTAALGVVTIVWKVDEDVRPGSGGLDKSSPYVQPGTDTPVGARFIAPDRLGSGGLDKSSPYVQPGTDTPVGARFIAPAQPEYAPTAQHGRNGSAHAQAAMFAAVCLAGAAVSFFDGITFNPYVHDMLAIALIANIVCAVGGIVLVGCTRLRDSNRVASAVFAYVAVSLGLAILGIALVSTALEGAGLPIGIVEGSCVLLLCSALAHLSVIGKSIAPTRFTLAALVCCYSPWAMYCGLAVKRSVGYSLATITPIVLVAIAALSIASLVLNAQSARHVSAMQEDYESELSRQQTDFAAERDAAQRHAAAQIERERRARERAVEAARREFSDRSPKQITSDRYVEVLEGFGLTSRECEVVMMAVQGHTIQGIGSELGIAKQTVNYHLHNIYEKLNVSSKSEMLTFVNTAVGEEDKADE